MERVPIGDRGNKLIARIPPSGQIDKQTNRDPVSPATLFPLFCFPCCRLFSRSSSATRKAHRASTHLRMNRSVIRFTSPESVALSIQGHR
jgi:hypothetical protein